MEILSARAPWYLAGPIVGLLIVALLRIANQPLGALGGYIEVEEWARRKRTGAGWRTFFIVGVVVTRNRHCRGTLNASLNDTMERIRP